MKRITLRRLFASIAMILTATAVMSAQSADIPWHVVVYENDQEVASHSIEIINDVQVSSEDVNFVLSDGQTFTYSIASTFKFEQRAGNGTAIETIASSQWNVYYDGSSLHFTESVNNVAVYSVSGIIVALFSGNYAEIPINLTKGVYIVQASGKSAKLSVTNNNGGASAQATAFSATSKASYSPVLRAATADLKQYWNITAAGSTTPIDISQVVSFYFTPDNTLAFVMSNGNTVQLADYNNLTFTVQPVQANNSNWDMDLTLKFGGASYVADIPWGADNYDMCVIAVAKDYIAAEGVLKNISNIKVLKKDITNPNFWTAKLTIFYRNDDKKVVPTLSQCHLIYDREDWWFQFDAYYPNDYVSGIFMRQSMSWIFNNNQPFIQTTIKLNADDSLTMSFTDVVSGTTYSHTFPAP